MYQNTHTLYYGSFYSAARKWINEQTSKGKTVTVEAFCEQHDICKKCKGLGCGTCGRKRMPFEVFSTRQTRKQKIMKKRRKMEKKILAKQAFDKIFG